MSRPDLRVSIPPSTEANKNKGPNSIHLLASSFFKSRGTYSVLTLTDIYLNDFQHYLPAMWNCSLMDCNVSFGIYSACTLRAKPQLWTVFRWLC